mgnify:CR=1 FL=1
MDCFQARSYNEGTSVVYLGYLTIRLRYPNYTTETPSLYEGDEEMNLM